jgi:adenine-specific DNA methylase
MSGKVPSDKSEQRQRWAIEDSFPIVEINRLAVPERNAFKPIYQMHKWFARRASCVFRAILLGCMKPLPIDKDGNPSKSGAEVIMEEFYKNHTHDPDTNGKVILDPFMGGGTTVVEALRLGCKAIGIDLNPVAWFIVKTETTPVNIKKLERAFEDLANRIVPWSGKPLKQTLLDLYKTTCPCCGDADADIIYTFWVKSAICTDPTCGKQVPLFGDYFVASKQPSIRYCQDVSCPHCHKTFDWEIEPASLIAEQSHTVVNDADGAGIGRGNKRWAFAAEEPVECPWCGEPVKPRLAAGKTKPIRKKVPLAVLLCPHCQAVWQYRGTVPDDVACPVCKHRYEPSTGNTTDGGKFVCPDCGKKGAVLDSVRSLPADQPLPISMYAIQGYCATCDNGRNDEDVEEENGPKPDVDTYTLMSAPSSARAVAKKKHCCLLAKSGGKFYKRIDPADVSLYTQASQTWERHKAHMPYPKTMVPMGDKTKSGLIAHNYRYWNQMFGSRQLLCLSTLIVAARSLEDSQLGDLFCLLVSAASDTNNLFTRFMAKRNSQGGQTAQGVFARHDFQPKSTICEQNVWGLEAGGIGSFVRRFWLCREGVKFQHKGWDVRYRFDSSAKRSRETVETESLQDVAFPSSIVSFEASPSPAVWLVCEDSRRIEMLITKTADHAVTDPPYAGNINYSELSDFYYAWLKAGLSDRYQVFVPDHTPKIAEIIENRSRGQTLEDFQRGLRQVFSACWSKIADDGLLVFTFHHAEIKTWEMLLMALCEAQYLVEAVYPVQAEAETSMHLMNATGGIAYDLVHVCRKRLNASIESRSWAGIRQEIRRSARNEVDLIESGQYGNEPLSPADVNIILIGKCLELYSRHYGRVLDHEGRNVPLHDALEAIRMEVDQLISAEQPLPSELAEIDPVSYVYLVCLADKAFEIKSDELHKYTRGVIEPDQLLKAGLIKKGRAGRGRTFEIKAPAERFGEIRQRLAEVLGESQSALPGMEQAVLADRFGDLPFIDYLHFLIALVDGGENLRPWLERFRGMTREIRAACEYLLRKQPRFADACGKILKFIEVTPMFG